MPRSIRSFPPEYTYLNDQVDELCLVHYLSISEMDAEDAALALQRNEDFSYAEFWIVLKDGRTFGFLAAMPEHLRTHMDREHELSFVSLGLLVVSEVTEKAIMDAVGKCLAKADYHQAEPFGYRMVSPAESEE